MKIKRLYLFTKFYLYVTSSFLVLIVSVCKGMTFEVLRESDLRKNKKCLFATNLDCLDCKF